MNALITNLHDRMADRNHTELFRNEMKHRISYYQRIQKKKEAAKKQNRKEKKNRVDGSAVYELNEPTGSFLDAIKLADPDNSAYIQQLLKKGRISPIRFTETERAASGLRRLKTTYRSVIGEDRESDLNFLQLQRVKKH